MTAKTWTGFGAPFIEIDWSGQKIAHNGNPFDADGWAFPAADGGVGSDFLPLHSQADEDKLKRLNELGFSLVTDTNTCGYAQFYINDEALGVTFVEIALPYTYDPKLNLQNLSEWLAGIDPDGLVEARLDMEQRP